MFENKEIKNEYKILRPIVDALKHHRLFDFVFLWLFAARLFIRLYIYVASCVYHSSNYIQSHGFCDL